MVGLTDAARVSRAGAGRASPGAAPRAAPVPGGARDRERRARGCDADLGMVRVDEAHAELPVAAEPVPAVHGFHRPGHPPYLERQELVRVLEPEAPAHDVALKQRVLVAHRALRERLPGLSELGMGAPAPALPGGQVLGVVPHAPEQQPKLAGPGTAVGRLQDAPLVLVGEASWVR